MQLNRHERGIAASALRHLIKHWQRERVPLEQTLRDVHAAPIESQHAARRHRALTDALELANATLSKLTGGAP